MKSCVEGARKFVEELSRLSRGEYDVFIEEVRRDRAIIRIVIAECSDCSLDLIEFLAARIAKKIGLKVGISGALESEPYTYTIEVPCSIQARP